MYVMSGMAGVALSHPLVFDAGPVKAPAPPGPLKFPSDFLPMLHWDVPQPHGQGGLAAGHVPSPVLLSVCAPHGATARGQPAPS